MKRFKTSHAIFILSIGMIFGLFSCTRHDQLLDETPPVLNTDTLYVAKGTATLQPAGGPAWDGSVEGVWSNAPALTVHAVVPDLGNNTFTGFIGNATDVTMRALYDANNIYFLVEFATPQENVKSSPWYYNPTTKMWAQESGAPSLNSDGTYRPPFIQDQFTMLWNIDNSVLNFNTLNCYAACHANSSYGGSSSAEGGVMHTNGPNERLDCWRARVLQVVNENQANDCFIDDGSSVGTGSSGILNKNEVHNDWQVHNGTASSVPAQYQSPGYAADGGFSNKQSLTINGLTTKENVPIWVIPSGNYNNGAIMIGDTTGTAVKVTGVDSTGVLHLADGSTIDPRTGTDYKQIGTYDGPKCIPGTIVDVYTGSRADVTCNAYYTGTGWRMLFKRALKTSDNVYDADFSSLDDMPFGIGVMFLGADNQHAIVAGLTMRFKK